MCNVFILHPAGMIFAAVQSVIVVLHPASRIFTAV